MLIKAWGSINAVFGRLELSSAGMVTGAFLFASRAVELSQIIAEGLQATTHWRYLLSPIVHKGRRPCRAFQFALNTHAARGAFNASSSFFITCSAPMPSASAR